MTAVPGRDVAPHAAARVDEVERHTDGRWRLRVSLPDDVHSWRGFVTPPLADDVVLVPGDTVTLWGHLDAGGVVYGLDLPDGREAFYLAEVTP